MRKFKSVNELVNSLKPDYPVYCIRTEEIKKSIKFFKDNFPGKILYAVKTNPNKEVLKTIIKSGIKHFDVASIEEIKTIKQLDPNLHCSYMHTVKSRENIREAYFNYNIKDFSLDTKEELIKILESTKNAKDLNLFIRVAVSNEHAEIDLSKKFGAISTEAIGLLRLAKAHSKKIGLSFHVGSQCMHPISYSKGIIEIGLSVSESNDSHCALHCWVKDNGIGISKENQVKLFTPFTQAESSIARKYGGTGLGLNISNNLLKLMGSSLTLESELERGSTFSFDVTFAVAADIDVPLSETTQQHVTLEGARVLLAEDNDINVEVIKALLDEFHLDLTHVSNGQKAIDALKACTYDLVLMDIQMPEVDGLSATRHIRNVLKLKTPIIALTANAMQQDIDNCHAAGMDAHVGKPVDKARLVNTLGEFLAHSA